jgi:hypothetical protein
VNLIIAAVVLLHRELVEVVREMIGGAGVHIPAGVNRVRARLTVAMSSGSSNLAVHVATIIINAEVVLLKPFKAARGFVAWLVTYLTYRAVSTTAITRAQASITIVAAIIAAVVLTITLA